MTMIRGGADEPITTLCGFIGFAQFPYHRILGLVASGASRSLPSLCRL